MKAAQALAGYIVGTDAEHALELQMPNGQKVKALLRPISDIEDAEAIAHAVKFAEGKGVPNATHGVPLFDKAMRHYTLYVATLDADSDPKSRERFFSSPDDLALFHPEWVLWLYQRWEILQDKASPLYRTAATEDLFRGVSQMASDDDDFVFFCGCSPATRATLARFSAKLALSSPELRSHFSLGSPEPP